MVPAKPFPSDCIRWEWFKAKEVWFHMISGQKTLSVVHLPASNCFCGKKGSDIHCTITCDEISIHHIRSEKIKSWTLPGNATSLLAWANICSAKTSLSICWDQSDVIHNELFELYESITGNGIKLNSCELAEHCVKSGHNTSKDTKRWMYWTKNFCFV